MEHPPTDIISESASQPRQQHISIVIPAYNEEENIAHCLDSIVAIKTDHVLEVIVVDNNSTDRTAKIAGQYADRLTIRVIHESVKGRGAARKTGFGEATGTIIFSTDADAVVPPDWISSFLETLKKDDRLVAATGLAEIQDCGAFRNTVFNTMLPIIVRWNLMLHGHIGLSGFSFAIKKSAYEAAGGFDATADAYEDLDLADRVHKIGKIGLVQKPRVIFSGRRFRKGLIRGTMEYLRPWVKKFILKKSEVPLSDVR